MLDGRSSCHIRQTVRLLEEHARLRQHPRPIAAMWPRLPAAEATYAARLIEQAF